jgi:hypothetical protein
LEVRAFPVRSPGLAGSFGFRMAVQDGLPFGISLCLSRLKAAVFHEQIFDLFRFGSSFRQDSPFGDLFFFNVFIVPA